MCSLIYWPILKWAGRRPLKLGWSVLKTDQRLQFGPYNVAIYSCTCVFVPYRLKHFMYSLLLRLRQKRFVVLSLVEIVVIHITQINKIGQSHCLIHQNLLLIISQYRRLVMDRMNDCPNVEMICMLMAISP